MIKVYDPKTNELLTELSEDPDDHCKGGEIGALCGGCDGCLYEQALFYGYRLEYE